MTFSRIDPGNKLVIGFRKASQSINMQVKFHSYKLDQILFPASFRLYIFYGTDIDAQLLNNQGPQTSVLQNGTPGETSFSSENLATGSGDSSRFYMNKGSKDPQIFQF